MAAHVQKIDIAMDERLKSLDSKISAKLDTMRNSILAAQEQSVEVMCNHVSQVSDFEVDTMLQQSSVGFAAVMQIVANLSEKDSSQVQSELASKMQSPSKKPRTSRPVPPSTFKNFGASGAGPSKGKSNMAS
jgi:hypothetical protein